MPLVTSNPVPHADGLDAGTSERLLEAAIETIETLGEVAVKVRDIAAAADVSFASVYHFYGSREGLIIAAQAERIRRLTENLVYEFVASAEQWRGPGDVWRDLDGLLDTACEPERMVFRLARTNALGSGLSRPELLEAVAAQQSVIGRAMAAPLARAQAAGWINPEPDAFTFVVWLRGLVNGRLLAEVDHAVDGEGWNAMAKQAVHAVLELPA